VVKPVPARPKTQAEEQLEKVYANVQQQEKAVDAAKEAAAARAKVIDEAKGT